MILTRTARSALLRIRDGKPAFRTPIPWGRGVVGQRIAAARLAAMDDLIRFRYVAKTPKGPKITATGRAALDKLDRYFEERATPRRRRGKPVSAGTSPAVAAEIVFGTDVQGVAERSGVQPYQVYARSYWAAVPLKFD